MRSRFLVLALSVAVCVPAAARSPLDAAGTPGRAGGVAWVDGEALGRALEKAVSEALKGATFLPDRVRAGAFRASAASKRARGDTEGAIADYTEAVRLDPSSAETFFLRGFTRREGGDWKGALADYNEAIRLDPRQANAHATRANARRVLGDLPGARADADEALRLDPRNLIGSNNRGLIRYAQNDLVGAADDHGRAIRIDPTFVQAWYHRGKARFYLGDAEGAIADYGEGIRLDPGDSDLYVARANARRSAGDLAGALDDYASARRLGAKSILGNICATRFRLGQREAAAEDCALARRTAGPDQDGPFVAQAGVLLLDGDPAGAEAALEEALRRNPRSAYALRLRGLLHSMRGDAAQADRDNAAAREIAPWVEKAVRDIFGHALFR